MKLKVIQIQSAKPKEKDYKLSDGHGLILIVKTSGKKLWRVRYRYQGNERMLAAGHFPGVSLAQAREIRDDARKLLAQGIDPVSVKREEKRKLHADNRLRSVVAEFLPLQKWSEKTRVTNESVISRYILKSHIADMPVSKIKRKDINEIVQKIAQDGKVRTGKDVLSFISRILNHAVLTERIDYNVCYNMEKTLPQNTPENYAHLKEDELGDFFRAIWATRSSDVMKLTCLLLTILALRPGELRNSRWDDVNFTDGTLNISPERMKKRRAHVVPLSGQAVRILRKLQQVATGDYIMTLGSDDPVSSEGLYYIIERAGYKGRVTPHGFRHSFSTILNEHAGDENIDSDWIDAQLAHKISGVRGVYNHARYMKHRRAMMEWYAGLLESKAPQVWRDAMTPYG